METIELAEKIYNYVNSIQSQRCGEHWDNWDDKREIELIKSLIENTIKDNEKNNIQDFEDDLLTSYGR